MAAGLTLERSQFETFRAEFDLEARRWLRASDIEGVVETDGELTAQELTLELSADLRAAGPWGQAFPEPLFDGVFDVLEQRIVAERHLKLRLKPAGAPPLDAIMFSRTEPCASAAVRAAYRLEVNEYRGLRSLQAVVEYLEPA